jgi:uncharacterized protein DUF4345
MAARIFLGLSALVWLPYGVYCFFVPGSLAEAAGVASRSATGITELRAMYGGLEAALGALCAIALLRPALVRPALVALGSLAAGLASARAAGIALDGELSSYTAMALALEVPTAAIAFFLLTREGARPAP